MRQIISIVDILPSSLMVSKAVEYGPQSLRALGPAGFENEPDFWPQKEGKNDL